METVLVLFILLAMASVIVTLAVMLNRKNEELSRKKVEEGGGRLLTAGYDPPPKSEKVLRDGDYHDEYDDLKERLYYLFECEKLYLNPEIRISDVADRLLTNSSHLSKVIRLKTGKNFCQLVHYYRIREAMRLFSANQKLTIAQLSQLVGFNSLTTFTTAFGRNTGYTPAEWCKNYRKKNDSELQYARKSVGKG